MKRAFLRIICIILAFVAVLGIGGLLIDAWDYAAKDYETDKKLQVPNGHWQ